MNKTHFKKGFLKMTKLLTITALVLFCSAMTAEEWKNWTFSPKSKQPDRKIRIENNQLTAEFHSDDLKRKHGELSASRTLALQKGKDHTLYAIVEAEKAGEIYFVYKHHDPYRKLGLGTAIKLLPGENRIVIPFTPEECPADKTPSFTIALGRINGKVTLKEFEIAPVSKEPLPVSLFPSVWKAEHDGIVKETLAKNGVIDFRKLFGEKPEKSEAILTARFSSGKNGILRIGIAANWWMEIFANGILQFSSMARGNGGPLSPETHFAEIPVFRGENTLKIRILSGSGGWSFIYGKPMSFIVPEETENWWRNSVPIKNTIVKGSALDLSGIIPVEKNESRIIYSPKAGGYAYEDTLDIPVRLFGAEALPGIIFHARKNITSEDQAKKELDLWAQSLKRRGYASVRMHTLDGYLCYNSKNDMQIDPKALDRMMYSFSCLKREGIRLQISILAYKLYSNLKNGQQVFNDRVEHKIGFMFLNDFECERFRFGAEKLLNTVNPYTGKRLIDDPLLFCIELYNEMETGGERVSRFYHQNKKRKFIPLQKKIESAWKDFLKRKGLPSRPLPDVSTVENDLSEGAALFYEFHTEQLDRAFHWGEKILRDMGWRGVIVNNSVSKRIAFGVSHWRCSNTVETHGYFAHPSGFSRSGSRNYQRSGIEGLAEQFRSANSVRQYGRGFQVGEFDHVYWNRYIHEGGMVYPALAAFQGHQIIAFFSSPYIPEFRRPLAKVDCFTIHANPVMMANGFLGAVLFGRGDIKPALHQGVLNIPSSYWKKGNTAAFPINSEQSKIALMTGLSIAFPDEKPAEGTACSRKPDFALSPANHGITNTFEWTSNLRDVNDGSFDLAAYTAELKKQGILPQENISDPAKGIFQTETGEIILNGPEKKMTIITPRTEAISWERNTQEKLGKLTVFPAKGHATVAASAVDGKDLADSSRIVLIFSTEAINSGMKLSKDWTKLFSNGKKPTLVRSGECKAELQTKPGTWKLYALGLDGERLEEIPLENAEGKLTVSFDTAKLKHGVTPFFELIRE